MTSRNDYEDYGADVPDYVRKLALLSGRSDSLELGCAQGAVSLWLKSQGYENCKAVDIHLPPGRPKDSGVEFIERDVMQYDIPVASQDLIIALDVVQFLKASAKLSLFNSILTGLRPGGVFILSSFSVHEPARLDLVAKNAKSIEPNTYWHERLGIHVSFFGDNEILDWFSKANSKSEFNLLFHEEKIIDDDHPPLGPHRHGMVRFACQKKR